jgi:serine/threonine protein kinase/Tol biopolymer transport system component
MEPERWAEVEGLYVAALEREESERAAFLKEACAGDEALRREVESLLAQEKRAKSFLEVPAAEVAAKVLARERGSREALKDAGSAVLETTTSLDEDSMVGRRLGVYQLVRRIGQGGMGTVFLAVRADGEFRQKVAIKLVLPGLNSDEVLKRFRNERQTLAELDHPNIVKLLDGGSTPERVPYLVMDYVEGSPIDEYCDTHKLSIQERLQLFGKVCEAVEYAHQRLVIHRDLKPSNILVTAGGVPKLLDFGIAKVLEPTAGTPLATHTGTRCMTPAYASPEQVRGRSVTPATDIYSLGVVLYELLAGHRPYRLKEHTPAEIERAICEQEPETPSTAVNRVETETTSDGTTVIKTPELVSQTREGQPENLRRRLRGDLDNIMLKALRKEPELRYETVQELAQDIDRHLKHVPIKARPPSLAYRASKFVQRHKIEASAALAAIIVLVAAALLIFDAFGLRDRVLGAAPAPRPRGFNVGVLTDFGRAEAFDGLTTDGTRLYFVERKGGHWGLMQVPLEPGRPTVPVPVPTPFPSVTLLGISPDHSALLVGSVIRNEQEVPLWALPLPAAAPRRLGDVIAHDAAWSPDGKRLVYARDSELYLANADGSQPRKLAGLSGSAWWPHWSPDGHVLRFTLKDPRFYGFSLWEISSDGTRLRPLLPGWRPAGTKWGLGESAGIWTQDGKYFLFRHHSRTEGIWAIREGRSRFWPARTTPVELYECPASLDFYTLLPSVDGKKLFFIAQQEHRQLAKYDLKTRQFVPYLSNITAQFPLSLSFSKDGQWLVYKREGFLFRTRMDGGDRVQLTSTPFDIGYLRFSPDGERIVFQGKHPELRELGQDKIFIVSAEGGEPEQITSGPYDDGEPEWSRDGNTVLFKRVSLSGAQAGHTNACLLDLKTKAISVLLGSEGADHFRWSPDGRCIFAKTSSGLTLFDFRSHRWRRLTGPVVFELPFWSQDSRYVYGQEPFGHAQQPIIRIRVSDGAIERVTGPDLALPPDVASCGLAGLTPDGSPMAVLLRKNSDIYSLDLDLP